MSAVLPSRLLPITPSSFGGRKPQRGSLSCRGDGKSTFLEDDSGLLSFTRITANHFERQTWSWKKKQPPQQRTALGKQCTVSLLPFVKLYVQTSLPSTKPPLRVSNPNQCHWPTFKELMRGVSRGPENVPSPNFCAPCSLPSHDQPVAHGHPVYYPILLAIRTCRWKNNSGVSRSWEPDPIVFCKSKKDQLSMVQICIPTPESVVTLTKTSRSELGHNLASPPRGDDVSLLITNCLFMLRQLPRAANKWLKECLDQAFRPLLSGGCYLVDSDGSSCLVWKGAELGRRWLTAGPSGQPGRPHVFIFPAPRGKPGPCLEVGG